MGVGPELELLGRRGCHLCDEMEELLAEAAVARGLAYRKVDVDSDPALARRWGEVVPVLLRNGRPVAKIRLDRRRLARILDRRR